MAESIVRLRVESQEFESKLKRASQELLAMADNARRTGATFAIADKEELAFVQSLGQLQTSARSAKGSIAEMTKAFQDLSMHYRDLTAEEKAAPYGQALEKSLQQLQDRINESKKSLGEINSSIGESKSETDLLSGAVNELTGKLGINIPKLGAMSIAIAAVTGAAKVAKDAFFANEQQLDEWGRMTESCTSVYNGFLDALNTGDISGYLQRINQIVDAARSAYDALDELGTYNAFNQVNVSRDKQRLTNAMADYREGKGSKADVQTASQAVIANLKEQYLKEQAAYVAYINKLAAERGMSGKDLMKIANGSYADFKKAQSVQMTGTKYKVHTTPSGFQYTTTEKVAANKKEANAAALRRINDTDWDEMQKLGAKAQERLNEIGQTRRQVARMLGQAAQATTAQMSDSVTVAGGRGGSGGGNNLRLADAVLDPLANIKFQQTNYEGGLISSDFSKQITELATMYVKTTVADSLRQLDPEQAKAMLQGNDTANIFRNAPTTPPPPQQQTAKEKSGMDEISKAAKTFGAMNNILSALQTMGIKLPEGLQKTVAIMQSLITVIQSVQSVVQMFSTSSQAANTLAVGANTVALGALTGAISANTAITAIPFFAGGGVVKSITGNSKRFANGGMAFGNSIGATTIQHFAGGGLVQNIRHHAANGFIGGNNYSGDLIPIAVNSGELILNKAQQGNLASQLSEGSSFANLNIEKRITAEDIRLVLNNSRRRRSRGETL